MSSRVELGSGWTPAREAEYVHSRFVPPCVPDGRTQRTLAIVGGLGVLVLTMVRLGAVWKQGQYTRELVIVVLGLLSAAVFAHDTLRCHTTVGVVKLAAGLLLSQLVVPMVWPLADEEEDEDD